MHQLQFFIQKSSYKYPSFPLRLNSNDNEFLKLLLERPSIPRSHRQRTIRKRFIKKIISLLFDIFRIGYTIN